MSNLAVPKIQVNDTAIVLVVPKRNGKKLEEVLYKISMTSSMPKLEIVISQGKITKLIQDKKKADGFKAVSMDHPVYSPLTTFTLSSDGIPVIVDSVLVELPVGDVVLPDEYKKLHVTNGKSLINGYLLPQFQASLLKDKYKDAMYNSWLLVGIQLMSKLTEIVTENKENNFVAALQPITRDTVLDVIVSTHKVLVEANAHISDTHKKFSEKIQQRLKAVEAEVIATQTAKQ
jgi:hypothetical protein